jgi:putative glutamine amidotransferase
MNKKRLVGIPLYNCGDSTAGCAKTYMEFAKQFGTVILLSPDTFISELDLLILPGGKDIANGNKENFSYYNSDNERFLEWFDANTLPKYIENNTPILGICRGMQAIVKQFNMPLVQNIWWDHGYSSDEKDVKAHKIHYTDYCKVLVGNRNILNKTCESFHHQGLLEKNLNTDEFHLLAVSDEQNSNYNIVEYMMHKTLPIVGIQGHPERSNAELPVFLVNMLLNSKIA